MHTPESDALPLVCLGLIVIIAPVKALGETITRLTGLRSPEFLLVPVISLLIFFLAVCAYRQFARRTRKIDPDLILRQEYGELTDLAIARYLFTLLLSYCFAGIFAARVPVSPDTKVWIALAIFVACLIFLNRLWIRLQRAWRGEVPEAELAVLKNPELSDGARLVSIMGDSSSDNSYAAAFALGKIGRDNVPLLIAALKNPDPRIRDKAAFALGELEADALPAVPALLETLADEAQYVRRSALRALGEIVRDDEQVTGVLIDSLKSADDGVRGAAAGALALASPNDPRTIPALLALAANEKVSWVASTAIDRIGRFGQKADGAVTELTKFLAHEDLELVDDARKAIEKIIGSQPPVSADRLSRLSEDPPVTFDELRRRVEKGKSVGPLLRKVVHTMTHGYPKSLDIFASYFAQLNPEERARAIKLLRPHAIAGVARICGPGYRCLLRFRERLGLPTSGLRPVRRLATQCLGDCGQLAAPVLEEALARDPWNFDAAQALLRLQPGSQTAISALCSIIMEANRYRRLLSIEILGEYAEARPGVSESLQAACHDPDSSIRGAAVEAIGRLSARSKTVISFDLALIDDPAEDVRRKALQAISRIASCDPRALEKALMLLADASASVREAAAKALGVIGTGSPQVVEALRKAESDGKHAVREAAREALIVISRT